MKEKIICVVTPTCRCYYHATPLAKEFLDKDQNLVHISGTIPDGEVVEIKSSTKTIKRYKSGKLDGKLEIFDLTSGELTFSEQYKDGVLIDLKDHTIHGSPLPPIIKKAPHYEGTVVKTNKNTQSFYVNGKEVAEVTITPQGSTVEQLGEIPNGPVKEFDENGQVRLEATYKDNRLEGVLSRYDDKGQLLSQETYTQGKLHGPATYYSYLMQGKGTVSATYNNMQLDGEWTSYFPDGSLCAKAFYQNGKLQGERVSYYHNGQVNVQETYENGKLNGQRLIYFPEGPVWYQENYKNGRLDGERFCFFQNGKKYLEEFYAEGLLEGPRKIYTETGDLLTSEEYHWGALVHNTERRPLK